MFCLECGTELRDESSACTQCGWALASTTPMAAAHPPAGDELTLVSEALAGEYEVGEELGRGGMAIVYRGREVSLDREVAIKVLPFTFAFDNAFVERFQREARTAARLEHPHIIPIHRVGRSGNVIYFTMKLLRGESLARTIATRGALRPDEIKRLLTEAGGALGYAHQHGVVHRDVKPDNIMFHETGHAVVCDFGIAKAATESRLTGTGTAIGTPHYMSPEQARAQPLDGRSDLYSLGVVAYKCLTGHVPFDAEDSYAIGIKHITDPPPDPGLETPEQRAIFPIIERLLEKAPDDRFATAEEMIAALEELELGTGRGPAVTSASVTAVTAAAQDAVAETELSLVPEATETPTTPMPRSAAQPAALAAPRRRKRRAPVLVGALLLLAGAGGGYVALTQRDTSVDPAPPVVSSSDASEAPSAEPGLIEQIAAIPVGQESVDPPTTPPPPVGTPAQQPMESPRDSVVPVRAAPTDTAPAQVTDQPPSDSAGARNPVRSVRRAVADSVRARAAQAGIGRLELRGLRNRSTLFIDGRARRGLAHQLSVGDHTIRIKHRDYEPFVRVVTIRGGEITRVDVEQVRNDDR